MDSASFLRCPVMAFLQNCLGKTSAYPKLHQPPSSYHLIRYTWAYELLRINSARCLPRYFCARLPTFFFCGKAGTKTVHFFWIIFSRLSNPTLAPRFLPTSQFYIVRNFISLLTSLPFLPGCHRLPDFFPAHNPPYRHLVSSCRRHSYGGRSFPPTSRAPPFFLRDSGCKI